MGGEKLAVEDTNHSYQGSPPRGRGKALHPSSSARSSRITPAWAGKSRAKCKANSNQRDHPRVGGEKPPALGISATDTGSPPRGRGKVLRTHPPQNSVGITPAWAGKSRRYAKSRTKPKDHPRVGGEKVPLPWLVLLPSGSPPRGRGKVVHGALVHCAAGITPAWAGKRNPKPQKK